MRSVRYVVMSEAKTYLVWVDMWHSEIAQNKMSVFCRLTLTKKLFFGLNFLD